MQAIANVPNWHYLAYSILAALLAVGTLMVTNVIAVPPVLVPDMPWIVLAVSFLGFFLPRLQTQTGPGAPPILSPPPKDVTPVLPPSVPPA